MTQGDLEDKTCNLPPYTPSTPVNRREGIAHQEVEFLFMIIQLDQLEINMFWFLGITKITMDKEKDLVVLGFRYLSVLLRSYLSQKSGKTKFSIYFCFIRFNHTFPN